MQFCCICPLVFFLLVKNVSCPYFVAFDSGYVLIVDSMLKYLGVVVEMHDEQCMAFKMTVSCPELPLLMWALHSLAVWAGWKGIVERGPVCESLILNPCFGRALWCWETRHALKSLPSQLELLSSYIWGLKDIWLIGLNKTIIASVVLDKF